MRTQNCVCVFLRHLIKNLSISKTIKSYRVSYLGPKKSKRDCTNYPSFLLNNICLASLNHSKLMIQLKLRQLIIKRRKYFKDLQLNKVQLIRNNRPIRTRWICPILFRIAYSHNRVIQLSTNSRQSQSTQLQLT